MKKIFLVTIVLTNSLIINSCSSVISKEDCKKDMMKLGIEHGKRGIPSFYEDIRKVCVANNQIVDLEAYQSGFNIGWSDFCTPYHGFEMGKYGDIYKSFCPLEKEQLFHEKFLIGKRVYEKKDQILDLEAKIKELTLEAEKNSSAKEELIPLQNQLNDLNKEIQNLEQKGMSLIHTN